MVPESVDGFAEKDDKLARDVHAAAFELNRAVERAEAVFLHVDITLKAVETSPRYYESHAPPKCPEVEVRVNRHLPAVRPAWQ